MRVVRGRAEEQDVDRFGVAVAKALAPPPVAAEWCLPLVAPGGAAVLYVGPSADAEAVGTEPQCAGQPAKESGQPDDEPAHVQSRASVDVVLDALPHAHALEGGDEHHERERDHDVARKRPLA